MKKWLNGFHRWNGHALWRSLGHLHITYLSGMLMEGMLILILLRGLLPGSGLDAKRLLDFVVQYVINAIGVIGVTWAVSRVGFAVHEKRSILVSLAMSNREQFHETYFLGVGLSALVALAVSVINVVVWVIGLRTSWSWGEPLHLFFVLMLFSCIYLPPFYAKDDRTLFYWGLAFVFVILLGLLGLFLLQDRGILTMYPDPVGVKTLIFEGVALVAVAVGSYFLGRRWHCRHGKG